MISPNPFNNDRTPKHLNPSTPNHKRKNIQYPLSPTTNHEYRKDTNQLPLSPQPYYYHKNPEKSLTFSRDSDAQLEMMLRELNEKITKMGQKLNQHDSILLKMSESSLQSNKEQLKRTHMRPDNVTKWIEPVTDGLNKLKRQFEEYKNNSNNKEHELKDHVLRQMILKSEEKMRGQMQIMLKKNSSLLSRTPNNDERLQEVQRLIRKLQKGVSLNVNKIGGLSDRIESINSSIDGHMDLINVEVNKAINKIVNFVNDKMSKPLNQNIESLSQKIEKLQKQQKILTQKLQAVEIESKNLMAPQNSHFGGMKSSTLKSHKQMTRAEYRQTLTAYNQEIIISESTYYIDSDGYLLDRQFFYLIKEDGQRIRLDERQIQMLMSERLLD